MKSNSGKIIMGYLPEMKELCSSEINRLNPKNEFLANTKKTQNYSLVFR